jgi:hypothetical protein
LFFTIKNLASNSNAPEKKIQEEERERWRGIKWRNVFDQEVSKIDKLNSRNFCEEKTDSKFFLDTMSIDGVCIDVTTIENHLDTYQREKGKVWPDFKTLLNRLEKKEKISLVRKPPELNDSPEIVLNRAGVLSFYSRNLTF